MIFYSLSRLSTLNEHAKRLFRSLHNLQFQNQNAWFWFGWEKCGSKWKMLCIGLNCSKHLSHNLCMMHMKSSIGLYSSWLMRTWSWIHRLTHKGAHKSLLISKMDLFEHLVGFLPCCFTNGLYSHEFVHNIGQTQQHYLCALLVCWPLFRGPCINTRLNWEACERWLLCFTKWFYSKVTPCLWPENTDKQKQFGCFHIFVTKLTYLFRADLYLDIY